MEGEIYQLKKSTKDSGEDKFVQDIVSKLKFVAKIKEGEILDVQTESLSGKGFLTSGYRTIFARTESRNGALDYFKEITDKALDVITFYIKIDDEFHYNMAVMVFEVLQESKMGIVNYQKTYKEDKKYSAEIETFLLILDTKIDEYNKKICVFGEKYGEKGRSSYFK